MIFGSRLLRIGMILLRRSGRRVGITRRASLRWACEEPRCVYTVSAVCGAVRDISRVKVFEAQSVLRALPSEFLVVCLT